VLAARAEAQDGPRVLSDGPVRVVYWPGARARAEEVLSTARRPLRLPGFPGRGVSVAATIVLAPSPQVFDSVTGGRAPEWGAGVAIPAARTIVLPLYSTPERGPEQLPRTLRHELIHLVLHQELPEPIPRWFDEGYAEWASGGLDTESAWKLRTAFVLGRAPPLDSLTLDWPREAERARLAYLLSATAVRHLAERSGPGGFPVLLDAWRREGSLERAIRAAYGLTMGQFEEEWQKMVRRRYGWLLALTQMAAFWFLVTLLFLVLVVIRKRRDRAKLAEMRAEERMLPPPNPDGVDVQYPLE
jgi:hypothetical protein